MASNFFWIAVWKQNAFYFIVYSFYVSLYLQMCIICDINAIYCAQTRIDVLDRPIYWLISFY